MKKKTLWITIFSILFIAVISFSIYAAFTMTQSYDIDVEHHQITNQQLESANETYSVTFTKPGDFYDLDYTLSNADHRNYEYYFTLSTLDSNSNEALIVNENYNALSMIYVYQGIGNDKSEEMQYEFIGVLSDFVYTPENLKKKNLTEPKYIFGGEELTSYFKLELHNGSSTYNIDQININLRLTASITTTNAQTTLYADNSTFDLVIKDVNSGILTRPEIPTVVLTEGVTTTKEYTIENDCIIDLCGNALELGADITVAEGVTVTIIDSRTGGTSTGSNFVLEYDSSYIELKTQIENLEISACNVDKLFASLSQYIDSIGNIICGSQTSLIGNYLPYLTAGLVTIESEDVVIDDGSVSDETDILDTNEVIKVLYSCDGNELELDFKYIGNDQSVFADIINNDLAHLYQFIDFNNGIQSTTNLFLPTLIKKHNATISWFSSNEEIMSNDGIAQIDQGNIILTATIKIYDKVFVQDYYIYVVQQDNLTKLQYLATRVEKGVTLPMNPDDETDDLDVDVLLKEVNQHKPLPVAGSSLVNDYYYYTNWTDGVDLGIEELSYEVESVYYYISTDIDTVSYANANLLPGSLVTSASVYLNQITYSKAARIKIRGYFDNGDVEETYITLTIALSSSTLANEVFEDVQNHLNSVNVLQNILDTREENGIINEKGDFEIPANVDVVNLTYTSLEPLLYDFLKDENGNLIKNENGNYVVVFKDLTHLSLTDRKVNISCSIVVEGELEQPQTATLSFVVPGAVTTNNFTVFDFDKSVNSKNIFYSLKFQTLQQSTEDPYYIKNNGGTDKKLNIVTSLDDIYAMPEYILMYDIQNTNQLMFEYGSSTVVIDYYDISVFEQIIEWATSTTKVKVSASAFSQFVDSGLSWIESDGSTDLSDEEITVIKAYAERFPGFMEIWNQKVNVLDNIISDNDYNALLQTLASDKLYVSILNWLTDSNGTYSLHDWLYYVDTESPYYYEYGKDYALDEYIRNIIDSEWEALSENDKDTLIKQYYYESLTDIHKNDVADYIYSQANQNTKNQYVQNYIDENNLNVTVDSLSEEERQTYGTAYIKDNLTQEQVSQYFDTLSYADKESIIEQYRQYLFDSVTAEESTNYYNALVTTNYNNAIGASSQNKDLGYLPIEFISLSSDGTENVTNDEERLIVYYVLNGHSGKYSAFYSNWKDTIKRKNGTSDNVKKIELSTITGHSYDYYQGLLGFIGGNNDKYTLNSCYDPLFKLIIEWVTFTNSSNYTSSGYTLVSTSSVLGSLLGDLANAQNRWESGTSGGGAWYCEYISQDEWNVLCTYLSYYGITQITVNQTNVNMVSGTYNSFPVTGIAESNDNSGYWLTQAFINAMINAVNAKYTSTKITAHNSLVDWSKNTTLGIVSWNSVITNVVLTGVDGYRIKDCTANISYDEDLVLKSYFSQYITTGFNTVFANALMSYYIGTDMTIENATISDSQYKNILNSVVPVGEFDDFIEKATQLQSSAPVNGSSYDNLSTISKAELEYIATYYKEYPKFIEELNKAITAYQITVSGNTVTVTPITNNGYDRTLSNDDKNALNNFINSSLEKSDGDTYKYIALDKISSSDAETFQILRYYSNLTSLLFRGTSTRYLFASNDDANRLFDIVATSVPTIEKITMSYCGVNDIALIENLINLTYLDLRGNYTKNEKINDVNYSYVGLNNISALIALNDNKNIYNDNLDANDIACKYISYLNVFNTDVTFKHAEVILDVLYNARVYSDANRPGLWYEYNGIETLYDPQAVSDRAAYDLVALLYDITEMSGNYIILPTMVYDENHINGVAIKWNLEETNGLVKYDSTQNKVERISSSSKGQIVISASVTVNGITATRYFVIMLE